MTLTMVLSRLLLLVAPLMAQHPPVPSNNAASCPYPTPSSIAPCECLVDMIDGDYQVFLYCFWEMDGDNEGGIVQFQQILDKFDTYNKIYVMEMTCDHCLNFELYGMFNENTTGRFEIEYFTVEHFDPSSLISSEIQFSNTALAGSKDSLVYAKVHPYHYFTPDVDMFYDMTVLKELLLHHLDTEQGGLPPLGSLATLRFLSLLDSNIGPLDRDIFTGLDNLMVLYMDRCQISSIESGIFQGLDNLNLISSTFNNISHIESGTFQNLPSLMFLSLGDNNIQTVDDTFEGANANLQILLQNNNIRTLDEATWRPFVERVLYTPLAQGLVDVDNNDLDCGCDVKWIVVDLKAPQIFRNARCSSGEYLVDLDPAYLEFFCPDQ